MMTVEGLCVLRTLRSTLVWHLNKPLKLRFYLSRGTGCMAKCLLDAPKERPKCKHRWKRGCIKTDNTIYFILSLFKSSSNWPILHTVIIDMDAAATFLNDNKLGFMFSAVSLNELLLHSIWMIGIVVCAIMVM